MRPLKLTLMGFHGVRDGMHRDSVTVDLTDLPPGLIAIVGPNGAGKTTIMDNLHPYPIMPSHASKMTADGFSYWDHLCGTRGEKDLEWEHAGKLYRSAFAFRNPGKSRKAEYYLFEKGAGDDWVPVQLPDGTLSDGKADTYNRCIEAVLGSPEAFFTSVFSAQNRRPIASYQAGEIKRLLAELLGIDHLRDLSAKAGEIAKALGRSLDTLQRELIGLSAQRERAEQLDSETGKTDEALATARRDRDVQTSNGAKLLQEQATLAAKQSAGVATEARLRELRLRQTELGTRRRQLEADLRTAATRTATRRSELQQLVASRKSTLAEGPAIMAAAEQRDTLQLATGQRQREFATLQQVVSQLEATRAQHAALSTELQGLEARGKSAAQFAGSLKAQADVIETVPCRTDPMHNTCPLLAQAREANSRLAEQVIAVRDLRASYQAKQLAMKPLAESLAALPEKRTALAALQAMLARDQQELQRLTALAARKPMLDVTQEALAQAERDLVTLAEEEASITARHGREVAEVDAQFSVVQRELSGLATDDVTSMLAAMGLRIRQSREAVVVLDGRIEVLIRQQASLLTERERVEALLSGLPILQGRADRLSDEIAQWKLLSKALGNDGIIALSIDDAGPALTRIVNDLLLACYGPRFTIAIQTQTTLANGEKREGFEIAVNDGENDSTKDFAVMSGGQKIWINECLTRGIALYRAQDTGQSFQTLFTDEADGPLDPERKRAFLRMKREVLRQGGYEREFFISHTPDLVDEADAVIDVTSFAAAA